MAPQRRIEIRPALPSDAAVIEAIDRDSFGPEDQYEPLFYKAMWTDPTFDAYVGCLPSGEVAGYVLLDMGCAPVSVYSIAVARIHRRRGIGAALMEFAASRARGRLMLWVRPQNDEAIRLYRRLGYEVVPGERGDDGQLVMRLRR